MEPADKKALSSWRLTLRDQRASAIIDLAVVAVVFVADWHHFIYFSKTPYLLALGWLSLRVRGLGWRSVGFTRPQNWLRTLQLGLLAGLAMEGLELFITQPLLVHLTGKYPDLSELGQIRGHLNMLLLLFAGTWSLV